MGVVGFSGLSGCIGDESSSSNGGTEPRSTPTETAASATETSGATAASPTPTPTETPVPFPETCGSLPDIDGLPSPPSELTEETVEAFVGEFERVYALATNEEYGDVESLRIHSVETVGERYVVSLSVDAVPATPTADAGGTTSTPLPPDAYTHRAVYRVTGERMVRELRSHIDDSLLSRTCWTLEGG
jgi:hypothetical protein